MKKLFNKCENLADIEKTNEILLYKYKIRRLFPDSKWGIKDMIERRTDDAKKNDFKIWITTKQQPKGKNHMIDLFVFLFYFILLFLGITLG